MIAPQERAEVEARLRAIPDLPLWTSDTLSIQPLLSLTNRSFRIDIAGESFALRLPRAGASVLPMDRAAEAHNAAIAAMLGFAPKLVFFDPAEGVMLTRFIRGATPLTNQDLRSADRLAAAAGLLRRLHGSGCTFRGEMHLFPTLDRYIALAGQDAPAAADIAALRRAVRPVEAALTERLPPFVPCHIDPSPGNFVAAADRLYLLDWEYAAMCEPLWDLGILSTEADFGAEQDEAMLRHYFTEPQPRQRSRLAILKMMLDLLAAAWAAMQAVHGNDSTDFDAYIRARLQRAALAAGDAQFARRLEGAR